MRPSEKSCWDASHCFQPLPLSRSGLFVLLSTQAYLKLVLILLQPPSAGLWVYGTVLSPSVDNHTNREQDIPSEASKPWPEFSLLETPSFSAHLFTLLLSKHAAYKLQPGIRYPSHPQTHRLLLPFGILFGLIADFSTLPSLALWRIQAPSALAKKF